MRSRSISLAWLPFSEAQKFAEHQTNIPSPEPSPAEAMAQTEAAGWLRQCLERLPAKHRQILLLRFFEDASLQDMAEVLGCSVGTVKSRLHHALEKLRKMNLNLALPKGDKQS
jgi:RNA polymerase sigma-70 factor (ECF subfamily)